MIAMGEEGKFPLPWERPASQGQSKPGFGHDACGVGLVCDIRGTPSHAIVAQGLEIVRNLTHRGACAWDAATGDGAGILIQLPDAFLRQVARDDKIDLPGPGQYASGLVFLPADEAGGALCRQQIETSVAREGQRLLGWRKVPVVDGAHGQRSLREAPDVWQVFVGSGHGIQDQDHFERQLFVIRRIVEKAVQAQGLALHIPSLSSRTFVYKGMFLAHQLEIFYPELADASMQSALAIVHQRYSTNPLPAWDLVQPFRFLGHNGKINTLRGNLNWLEARQALMASQRLGPDLAKVLPLATAGASDSACLDAVLELLYHSGRSLPHAIMMLIPEVWEHNETISEAQKGFYEFHAGLMEPWDGPAAIAFTDGRWIGAVLDRNGLRPSRYTITRDGLAVLASETGVLDIAPERIREKGCLQPGRMFLVDLASGALVSDEEIKSRISGQQPYVRWVENHQLRIEETDGSGLFAPPLQTPEGTELQRWLQIFGYTQEDLHIVLAPMAENGEEPHGSMGDDIPPAVLPRRPRLLYDYFRQLFAQVTSPPLDAIGEALVTSLTLFAGPEHNLLAESPAHGRRLKLDSPILTAGQLAAIAQNQIPGLRSATLSMCFAVQDGAQGLHRAMEQLGTSAAEAVRQGADLLVLSDRGIDAHQAPIPALLAVAGVHHYLIRQGLRTQCDLIVESAEPREGHHFCCLLGYGAAAVHPYLAMAAVRQLAADGRIPGVNGDQAVQNCIHAMEAGILKVMSKMGICALQSYRGAQTFECLGLSDDVVQRYFTHTFSPIGGAGLEQMAEEIAQRHNRGFQNWERSFFHGLESGVKYQWRHNGEKSQYTPQMLALIRRAIFDDDSDAWNKFAVQVHLQNQNEGLLRGLIQFKKVGNPIPIATVEPWTAIVRRFKTRAMSYGSISRESHETLAIAMNRIGARSNSGEGGEDPDRFTPDPDGTWRNSAIKQVAPGRFGVTGNYLLSARELQIKIAQGAKPGEGGRLAGFKVYPWIAAACHSTPYVGLISPPLHHDIYSIEDLAQLIHDLKCANPEARISVKLVSATGVGAIAAGAIKGGAHAVLISGESGGPGECSLGSIRYCGMPWELGLPDAHQTLMRIGLRDRAVLECDGQLKTGRDVAVACLLGAEEFGFGSLALIALGCVMMRVCHRNTCPVGIATQDPELRIKFTGRP